MVDKFQDTFSATENPFADKPVKPREKRFERPDPSKKIDCREDRPIVMNPKGQYNLNFIDWDNEWETVADADPNNFESPIPGMDAETFAAIHDEYFHDDEEAMRNQKVIQRLDTKTVNKNVKKLCAICIIAYKKGDKVFKLNCGHDFHTTCI